MVYNKYLFHCLNFNAHMMFYFILYVDNIMKGNGMKNHNIFDQ